MLRRVVLGLVGLMMMAGAAIAASTDWFIWERVLPAPVTRADWLAVAQEPGPAPMGEGWRRFDTMAYPTFAAAMAAMETIRSSPQFLNRCDPRWNLYKNVSTNELAPFDARQSGPIGQGYILFQTNLCCETAFDIAFGSGLYRQCGAFGAAGVTDMTAKTCKTTGHSHQPARRKADGTLEVEAANIHTLQCHGPKGPQTILIYQYTERPGNRVIIPGQWGKAVGDKDFTSIEEAASAAATAHSPPATPVFSGITGEYRARDGRMCLTESGGRVTGYYNWSGGGEIEGSLQGRVLAGTWKDKVGKGQIRYEFAADHAGFEHIWKGDGGTTYVTAGQTRKVSDQCSFAKPH